jgi:hypothetical protein
LLAVLDESDAAAKSTFARTKALGDANRDLVYTPLTPCRLVDTRLSAGAFAPNERRPYVVNGACGVPQSNVGALMLSFTTQNLTPSSGGYLALVAPGAPISAVVDVFNLGSQWSASNTVVATGAAGQFDAFVSTASAHLIVDVLGYFGPPAGGGGSAVIPDASITASKLAPNGCAPGQVLKFNGSFWACAGAPGCAAGDIQPCYTGPPGTLDVGICKPGRRMCDPQTGTFGQCAGQVIPAVEVADGLDNNCNGVIDEVNAAPQVTNSWPGDTSKDALVTAPVRVAFSQPMNPSTLNTSTFTVAGPGGTVPGSVSYSASTATFMPTARLATNADYTATVTTGAQSQAGLALGSNFAFSFTTSENEPAPHVYGCPIPESTARVRPLSFNEAPRIVRMAPNEVTAYRLVASPTGRASVQFAQGQVAVTPGQAITDFTVSRCPGVIEPSLHPSCKFTGSFVNFNTITVFNRLPQGYTSQEQLAGLGCLAPSTEQYYVNVKWSFQSCPYGPSGCGFSHQWQEGPY